MDLPLCFVIEKETHGKAAKRVAQANRARRDQLGRSPGAGWCQHGQVSGPTWSTFPRHRGSCIPFSSKGWHFVTIRSCHRAGCAPLQGHRRLSVELRGQFSSLWSTIFDKILIVGPLALDRAKTMPGRFGAKFHSTYVRHKPRYAKEVAVGYRRCRDSRSQTRDP